MEKKFQNLQSRRDFLRQAACAAVGTISVATTIRDLRFINAAAAQDTFSDYKALVCIFLSGGNDSNNLIVPRLQTEYNNYASIRQNLALPLGSLLPVVPQVSDGREYGIHPRCDKLQTLFGEGKLAFVFNVGPLLYPMTREQYRSGSLPRPPQLFSHSDQVTHWQTSLPDQPPRTGWGGRMADLLHPRQLDLIDGIPSANSAKISMCTSLAGANTFEVGGTFQQYHVSTSGAVLLSGVDNTRLQAVKDILSIPTSKVQNLQRRAYADVVKGAIDTGQLLNTAISNTSSATFFTTPFPTTSLGNQLRMVARLIEGRGPAELNMKRQVFFCSVGGYDTHTSQVGNTAAPTDQTVGPHANLLNEVSEAMFAFQRAIEQLGVGNAVTSFTASDFGRTFPTNGQGSDHGWGSHHMVMGGAVRGKQTYGTFPVHQINGPDDTSTGRWIPKIAVDQYAATLARWFGVSNTYMSTVFPNIGRFPTSDLGFMT
jgi:uncharacterized protein (DUF1501 family)